VRLAHVCGTARIRLVSLLVLNAQLYDPPPVRPASTPGVKPKKGPRQPKLCDRVAVRRELWATWANRNSPAPPGDPRLANPPAHLLSFLVDAACYAA